MNNKFKQATVTMKTTYQQILVLVVLLGVLKGEPTPEPPTSFELGNIKVFFDRHFIGEYDKFGFITPLATSDYLIGSTDNQESHRTFYRFSEGVEKEFKEMEQQDGPLSSPPYWNGYSSRNNEVIFACPNLVDVEGGTVFLLSFKLTDGILDMTNPGIYELNDASYFLAKTQQGEGERYVALGYNSPALITPGSLEVELIKIGPFLKAYYIYGAFHDKTPESTLMIVTCYYHIVAGSIDYTILAGGEKSQDLPYLTRDNDTDEGRLIQQAEIDQNKILVALQIYSENLVDLPFLEITKIEQPFHTIK